MPYSDQPTRIHVLFSCDDGRSGWFSVYGQSDSMLTLTIILQRAGNVWSWDIDGDGALIAVPFLGRASVVVLARGSRDIVASGIFEIDCALAGVGQLLIPRAVSNLIVTQELQVIPHTAPLAEKAVHA